MGVTVQVRDLDERIQEKLKDAAQKEGLSLSAFLRQELTTLTERLELQAKIDALGNRNAMGVRIGSLGMTAEEITREQRELRGE